MKKLFLSLAFLLPMMGTMAQTQVKTAEGILEGKDLSGIKVFKGVPFAAPPVGNLRWKAPQPAKHWDGVREAKEYGPNPMQEPLFGDMNFGTKVNSDTDDCRIALDVFEHLLEGGATNQFHLFITEILMGSYVMKRPQLALYCYSLHLYCLYLL